MNSSRRSSLALASLLAAIQPIALSAAPSVEETILVPDVSSATINLSPRGAHAAVVIPKGSRQAVVFDGVEGPRFDQLQTQVGEFTFTGNGGRVTPRSYLSTGGMGVLGGSGHKPVVFTDDGRHWAYVGRTGGEHVLMHDGKEVHRGAYQMFTWLAFSPDGARLVAAATSVETGQSCIIVDGKAGPWGADTSEVFFTPDGAHYAYTGRQNDAQQTRWAVVDGRQVKFFGDLVGYLPNGTLLSRAVVNYDTVLLANGKPISQVSSIGHLAIAPVTGRLIMSVTPPLGTPPTRKPSVLTVDGQIIAGTEDVMVGGVWFSPDGKRYAVLCQRITPRQEKFMIVDGKTELAYQDIWATDPYKPGFSPDSTQFLYIARSANGQTFVVVNGEESDGLASVTPPVWSATGSRLAWGGTTPAQKQVFYIDGKSVALPNNMQPGSTFRFSPDGTRTTWSFGPPNGLTLVVDGAPLPGVAGTGFVGVEGVDGTGTTVKFSPDGRHVAYAARESTGFTKSGVWVDGAHITPSTRPQINRVTFTPDSRHVAWAVMDLKNNNQGAYRIFVDGQDALLYASSPLDNMPHAWSMGEDGVLTIIAIDDGALKRYRITPAADTSVAAMVAAAGGVGLAAPAAPAAKPVSGSSTPVPAATAAPTPGPATAGGKPVDPAAVANLNRINDERARRGQPPLTAPGYTYVPADQRAAAPAPVAAGTPTTAPSPASVGAAPRPVAAAPAAPPAPLTYADLLRRPELWPAQCTMKETLQFQAGATIKAGQKVKVDGLTVQEVELSTLDNKIQFVAAPDETDVLAVANTEYAALTPAQRELTYATIARRKELWPYRLTINQAFDLGRGQAMNPGDTAILVKFERGNPFVIAEKFRTSFTVAPQATDLLAQARRFVEAGADAPSRVGTELEGKLVSSVTGQPTTLAPASPLRYYVFYRGSSTCSITRNFTPSLVKFYDEQHAKHPEFEIIYMMTEEPAATGRFAREAGFAWPAVEYETTGKMPVAGEPFGSLLPQLVVMDATGTVLASGVQQTAPAALQKLAALLNQPAVR